MRHLWFSLSYIQPQQSPFPPPRGRLRWWYISGSAWATFSLSQTILYIFLEKKPRISSQIADNNSWLSVADPGFPWWGTPTPRGTPTYDFANFRRKLHENEEIWAAQGRGAHAPCDYGLYLILCTGKTILKQSRFWNIDRLRLNLA